jgi:hypothetical protein
LGIGNTSHGHLQPSPVYGVEQGSTDAPARWGFVCDHLINLYKQHASDAFIYAPISGVFTNYKIAVFVDDSALTATQQTYDPYIVIKVEKKDKYGNAICLQQVRNLKYPNVSLRYSSG